MENSDVPGYVTEKLLNAYATGAVPVYWGGGGTVTLLFDERSFLWVDPNSPKATFERIRYLDANYTAFREMVTRPIFKPGAIDKYLSLYRGYPLGGTGAHGDEIRRAVMKFVQ